MGEFTQFWCTDFSGKVRFPLSSLDVQGNNEKYVIMKNISNKKCFRVSLTYAKQVK